MSTVKRVHVCSAEMLKLITQRLRRSEQWSCPHQLKALQHTHTALTEREDRLNILSFRIWHSLAHFLLHSVKPLRNNKWKYVSKLSLSARQQKKKPLPYGFTNYSAHAIDKMKCLWVSQKESFYILFWHVL